MCNYTHSVSVLLVMPGKVFHKEIADIIKEGSRKTVIILSPDYLSSEWCVYETNLAVHKSPSECQYFSSAAMHDTWLQCNRLVISCTPTTKNLMPNT